MRLEAQAQDRPQIPYSIRIYSQISPVSVKHLGADRAVMWPQYFVSALHGVADDWGECLRRVMVGLVWGRGPTPQDPKIR